MSIHRWTSLGACLLVAVLQGSAARPLWAQADDQPVRGGGAGRGADNPADAGRGGGGGGRGRGGGLARGRGGTQGNTTAPADLQSMLRAPGSQMGLVTTRYTADRRLVDQFYNVTMAPMYVARLKRFEMDWQAALKKIDAGKLSPAAQEDLNKLLVTIQNNLRQLDADAARDLWIAPLLPFAPGLVDLEEARRRGDPMDAEKAAIKLDAAMNELASIRAALMDTPGELANGPGGKPMKITRSQASDAAQAAEGLVRNLNDWFGFYNDYDPLFTWWMAAPYKNASQGLKDYAAFLRDRVANAAGEDTARQSARTIDAAPAPPWDEVPDLQEILAYPQNELRDIDQQYAADRRVGRNVGLYEGWLKALKTLDFDKLSRNAQVDYLHIRNSAQVQVKRYTTPPQQNIPHKTDNSGLPGNPIGRQQMIFDLQDELIFYTPEEILAIADKEYDWCLSEAKKASNAMGCGDDWKKAMEVCKEHHVIPGKQPDMIRGLIREDVAFLRANDLVTVPEVDAETIRMIMMSLQRQQVNPFFTGGTEISVSYPLMEMTTQQKLESMRGNNWDFARATVHHELIPGHNLQGFMNQRFRGFRGGEMASGMPCYGEGWAVYWEMMFYNMGFAHNPEERLGFLYWRMMRTARIHFSLNFHLGNWSAQQCVDCLVNEANSERENAIAEVRRAFNGSYGALYQAGYLLGALEFRELRKELVDSHQLTERQYHDGVLQQVSMPVELVRLALSKQKLSPDMSLDWEFYGPNPGH